MFFFFFLTTKSNVWLVTISIDFRLAAIMGTGHAFFIKRKNTYKGQLRRREHLLPYGEGIKKEMSVKRKDS